MGLRVLYGVAIHKAAASKDLVKMKEIRSEAKAFLEEAKTVEKAMSVLDEAIAKLERM